MLIKQFFFFFVNISFVIQTSIIVGPGRLQSFERSIDFKENSNDFNKILSNLKRLNLNFKHFLNPRDRSKPIMPISNQETFPNVKH